MGNVCYSEYGDGIDWRREAKEICLRMYDQQQTWMPQILNLLPNLQLRRELLLRDIYLMNATFQNQKQDLRNQEENQAYRASVKKFQRRTGMADQDQAQSRSFTSSHEVDSQSCLYHEKSCSINFATKQSFEYFAHFTDIIKSQMKINELGKIIEQFKSYFIIKNNEDKYTSLKQFSDLLFQLVVSYYDILKFKEMMPKQAQLINNDTILNFINNCLLQDEEIYICLYEKLCYDLSDKINQTKQIFQQNRGITCAEIGIAKEFQYNDYSKAIEVIKKLKVKPGPASKAKVIIKLSKTITTCMMQNRGGSLVLASDDVLPVIKYIVIKSQLEDIDIHIFITRNFLTQNILSSSIGFFLTSLEAVLEV